MNMKENYLIAVFLDMSLMEGGWFDYKNVFGGNRLHRELRFHYDWNWLMKAVDKCYESGAEGNEVGDITHALLDCDRKETHKAVVSFIRENTDIEKIWNLRNADMDSDLN